MFSLQIAAVTMLQPLLAQEQEEAPKEHQEIRYR